MAWALCGEITHSISLSGDIAHCRAGSKGKEEGDEGEELHC